MPALRYISAVLLILMITLQSGFVTVWALTESDVIVHTMEDLEIQAALHEEITEADISSLIASKEEFSKKEAEKALEPTFIVDPFSGVPVAVEGVETNEITTESNHTPFFNGEKDTKIRVNHSTKRKRKIEGTRGAIAVNINEGTMISSSSGALIDPTSIDVSTVSSIVQSKADTYNTQKTKKNKKGKNPRKPLDDTITNSDVFEFGIPGTHLIFSSPVAITIETPLYSDGTAVDIAVLHAGDADFNTSGLSTSTDTLCNSDGSTSNPGSQAIVKNGKITFYTCGASTFTMNTSGGNAGSNDLRIIVGDCGQVQLYYNGQTQVYGTAPTGTTCNGAPSAWPVLRIGNANYGNGFTAWTTKTTSGSTNGNTYTATSTMTRNVGGRVYTLIIDWEHIAPNKFLTWKWRVIVPTGNTANIKLYYGMDSAVADGDNNDVGYYSNTGGQTVGIFDSTANIISAFRYISGPAWSGYQANSYGTASGTVRGQITNGNDFTQVITPTGGDLGFGINWNFGTAANVTYSGAVEWRLLPYVSANVPDLVPGIGQPEGPLTIGYNSQLPITLTNAGNLSSSGIHTAILTLPATITGPNSAFVESGWSCGAQVGTTVTCTKTTTIAPLATETFRIPVIPTGGTSANFSVAISNPSDSNTSNNTASATNSVITATVLYSPGGVTGMTFWAKADGTKNCSTAGCTVTTWYNSGTLGNAANAVTGLGTVTYDTTNRINGNPTLYFNSAALNTNSNLSITTAAASIFTVSKLQTGGIFRIGTQTATNNALDWSTLPALDRLALYNGTVMYNGANQRSTVVANISSTSRATTGASVNRTDGLQTLTSATPTTAFTSANIGIGRTVATNSVLANVGEVIIYPTEITGANRNKVESYLAIKYGSTLNQTTPQNYTLSSNAIAWNGSIAGTYNKDIAGIARDDTSSLNQGRSQSINYTGDIIVNDIGSIGTNLQSLLWGNNGDIKSSFTLTDAPFGFQRMAREWQFQEKNGDLGNVKISYPVSALPIGAGSPIYLFADSDGIFATGATVYTGTLNGSNWEFTVNVSDMQYLSFGQPGDPIPPTITTLSQASGSLFPIGNFPITVGYNDTGSLIDPASFGVRIYAWDGVGAWTLTDIAPSYMTISGTPSTTTGSILLSGLPFGKYRFDISIADNDGNTTTESTIYYVDAIEWTVSSDQYDIGTIIPNTQVFGTGNMVVTVKTVGAGFLIKMTGSNTLATGMDTINYWNGLNGWGYDSGGGLLGNPSTGATIANQGKNINTNGLKNTYVFNIKYGVNINTDMVAGLYNGSVKIDLVANY